MNDTKIVMVILDALSNILEASQRTNNLDQVSMMIEECDGLDKIESLQQHENSDVYQLSLAIIKKYFAEEVRMVVWRGLGGCPGSLPGLNLTRAGEGNSIEAHPSNGNNSLLCVCVCVCDPCVLSPLQEEDQSLAP